ncbi:MAG TPA: hypothetical protein VKN18_28050 [Blastocatellia bacterium]|nr:hypothetical protein [Blastocatellia bacterium]
MERTTRSKVAFALTVLITLASLAMAAPKTERSSRITIEGRVLQINAAARTLLVTDQWSKKLYLVTVPKEAGFKITFGMNANYGDPQFSDVRRNDRVRMRCTRNKEEHLSRLSDGREVVVLTAVN